MGDDVAWNIFRYVADYTHLTGMILGLVCVLLTRSVDGFSRKTQIAYLLVYISRYLDVFTDTQVMYLLVFKATFITITLAMLFLFHMLSDTYDEASDSCNLLAILLPTGALAFLTSVGSTLQDELWTWSEYLEPFALVPQYIICYKAKNLRPVTIMYVLLLGGYRFGYIMNWIYKRYKWHGAYHDYTSWCGGILECILFVDFVMRFARTQEGASLLGSVVLSLDHGAGRASEKFEMAVLGRRLPYGISGAAAPQEAEMSKRDWDASDKRADAESSGLLSGNPEDDDDL